MSSITRSSATFRSNSKRGRPCFGTLPAKLKFASEARLSALEFCLSGVRRGSAGRNALVAADPFQPSSPLIRMGLAGGINDPLVAASTAIGAATPLPDIPDAKG